MVAYNPNGAEPPCATAVGCTRDEGYLFWLGWLAHVGNSTFQAQDANGIYRRIYLTANCQTITSTLANTPLSALINAVGPLLAVNGGPC